MSSSVQNAGFRHFSGWLDSEAQDRLLQAIRNVIAGAPLYQPTMPRSGRPLSVRMTNCGRLGWVSDIDGYRYQPVHPVAKTPWPPMPQLLLDAWQDLSDYPHQPEACLINYYASGTRMGQHQDRDELDFSAPVVSLSLGDDAIFRIGGARRSDPSRSLLLKSGDAVVLGGEARLAFHGVDRIVSGTSALLPEGGRINLTLRRVSRPHG